MASNNPTQLSPGVNATEIDNSLIVSNPASTRAALVGEFRWGPSKTPLTIDSEKTLTETFGSPVATETSASSVDFQHAVNFLKYADSLTAVRALNTSTALNAGDVSTKLIANEAQFGTLLGTNDPSAVDATNRFVARYPGVIGNSLKVVAIDDLTSMVTTINAFGATGLSGGGVAAGVTYGAVTIDIDQGTDVYQMPYRVYFINGTGAAVQNTIVPAIEAYKTSIEDAIVTNGLVYKLSGGTTGAGAEDPKSLIVKTPNITKLPTAANQPTVGTPFFFLVQGTSDFVYSRMAASGGWINSSSGANPSGITAQGLFVFVSTATPEHVLLTTPGYRDLSFNIPAVNLANGSVSASVSESQVFSKKPATSSWVEARGGTNDEISIAVIDEGGEFTGVKGKVLEVFELLSKASDAKDPNGSDNYYKTVINNQSRYIYACADLPGSAMTGPSTSTFGNLLDTTTLTQTATNQLVKRLSGGTAIGFTSSIALYAAGYEVFEDTTVAVDVIIDHRDTAALTNLLVDLAETRKDCMVASGIAASSLSLDLPAATAGIINSKQNINSSSYLALVAGSKFIQNPYTFANIQLNHSSDLAGLICASAEITEAWFSPAGYNRGQLKNVSQLLFNPRKTFRDDLYKQNINSVINEPGGGILLLGDRTNQLKTSAMSNINVRRLFIVLQKAIKETAKFILFEINDEYTRSNFRSLVTQYLREIQSRRGVTDFRVVCDTTNNTAEVIDRGQLVMDIYVKPTRSINFIQLNFIGTRSDATFSITE